MSNNGAFQIAQLGSSPLFNVKRVDKICLVECILDAWVAAVDYGTLESCDLII